jgi:hypothetical protein
MAQIAIAVHYEGQSENDHYAQIIVESDKEPEDMIDEIKALWDEFQATEPETDDDFYPFLEERGYRTLEAEPILLILNG